MEKDNLRAGHAKNLADYPHLTFNCSPGWEETRSKWNEKLDPYSEQITLEDTNIALGIVSKKLSLNLLRSLRSKGRLDFELGDCSLDYIASCMKGREIQSWKEGLIFFDINKNLDKIKMILEEMQPFIESHIGNFKLINTKAWDTLSTMELRGPLHWHKDSRYPDLTYKIFMYPNGADENIGTTKFMLKGEKSNVVTVRGKPGTFVLFNPVKLMHCGIRPKKRPRPMVEFILMPWSETIIEPEFHGTNSTHPIEP